MSPGVERLLDYDIWANRVALDSLRPAPPPRSLRWMAHIVGAEHLWLARLQRKPSPLAVWPDLTVAQCAEQLSQLSQLWPDYLARIAGRLGEGITYTNSKGEEWTSTIEDILVHVTIHSAYHRGQIASDVRAAGRVPAYTDFIHAVRQGFVA